MDSIIIWVDLSQSFIWIWIICLVSIKITFCFIYTTVSQVDLSIEIQSVLEKKIADISNLISQR